MRFDFDLPTDERGFIVLSPAAAQELERRARAARAHAIGALVADAVLWVARLPRRLAELAQGAGSRQRA